MNRNAGLWILGCVAACTIGCEQDDAGRAVAPSAQPASVTLPPADVSPALPARAPEPELATPESASDSTATFAPPFPDRLELFEAPKRAQSNVRRDDEHGETVELKGFVHVDQPRVVLSIDGQVSPVAEGGEKYGVRVISIQPPSVVLQRGRNRWTATLE